MYLFLLMVNMMLNQSFPAQVARSSGRMTLLGYHAIDLLRKTRTLDTDIARPEYFYQRAGMMKQCAENICRSHGLKLSVTGAPIATPAIYVSNHLSYIDPILIISQIRAIPIAKSETAGWPVIGGAMNSAGVIFIVRNNATSGALVLRQAMRILLSGISILNFPEGTTTYGENVNPFHRGIFGVSKLTGIPIVPMRIKFKDSSLCWVGGDLFFPHYLKTASRHKVDVQLSFGSPVYPEKFDTPERLAEYCRQNMIKM